MDFDGLGLYFCFGTWCCCLYAEFYGLNITSIMESVVLKFGRLLRSRAYHTDIHGPPHMQVAHVHMYSQNKKKLRKIIFKKNCKISSIAESTSV